MTSALRWAAMRTILMLHNCEGQSHKTVSTDHNFLRERRAEADLYQGSSAYQPNALPLSQTGSWKNVGLARHYDSFSQLQFSSRKINTVAWVLFPQVTSFGFCSMTWGIGLPIWSAQPFIVLFSHGITLRNAWCCFHVSVNLPFFVLLKAPKLYPFPLLGLVQGQRQFCVEYVPILSQQGTSNLITPQLSRGMKQRWQCDCCSDIAVVVFQAGRALLRWWWPFL